MNIGVYEKGQIPLRPITIGVRDEVGNPIDLTPYPNVKVRLRGSDNEEVDLTGAEVVVVDVRDGRVAFHLPKDRSLFTKTGEYVFDLELNGPQAKDYTTSAVIRVRELGRVVR